MKMTYRRRAAALFTVLILLCLAALSGCGKKEQEQTRTPKLIGQSIIHEPEFGGVYVTKTIEEFNELGFFYGDSVTVTFSNGYKLDHLPYYSGYFTLSRQPLLVAYPGYDYIKLAINNGADLWEMAGLSENDTADIVLCKSEEFVDVQNARDISYTDLRTDYPSDEVFANFRACTGGSLGKNVLYRSASPCDNKYMRASYVDALIKQDSVNCILDLADDDTKIQGYIAKDGFNSPYFLSLYEDGKVIPVALNMNLTSPDFMTKITKGLRQMIEQDGPYLVHCTEGKDRTGFVCMLLEALMGASYQEIETDYMTTYENYYFMDKVEEKKTWEIIIEMLLKPMIRDMAGDQNVDPAKADLQHYAEAFLQAGGLTEEEIATLKAKLS